MSAKRSRAPRRARGSRRRATLPGRRRSSRGRRRPGRAAAGSAATLTRSSSICAVYAAKRERRVGRQKSATSATAAAQMPAASATWIEDEPPGQRVPVLALADGSLGHARAEQDGRNARAIAAALRRRYSRGRAGTRRRSRSRARARRSRARCSRAGRRRPIARVRTPAVTNVPLTTTTGSAGEEQPEQREPPGTNGVPAPRSTRQPRPRRRPPRRAPHGEQEVRHHERRVQLEEHRDQPPSGICAIVPRSGPARPLAPTPTTRVRARSPPRGA